MHFIQPLIDFLHNHPHWSGFIVYLIACSESLAVIGTIIPGSVTMTAVGILIGANVIPAWNTLLWAVCGAFTGDCLSFGFGIYFQDRLRTMWPFRKRPQWLDYGEGFFERHGGKSILIGRFFGPMRSTVPLVAGMLKMSKLRFVLAAAPSAAMWAFLYIVPGILLGALSLELPPTKATAFIVYAVVAVAVLWLIGWLIHHFFKRICHLADRMSASLWHTLHVDERSNWITKSLSDPRHPEHHQQMTLILTGLLTGILFVILLIGVVGQGFLTTLNDPLFYLFRSFRTPTGDGIAIVLTQLGDKFVVLSMAGLVLIWLAIRGRWRAAIHWTALCALATIGIKVLKILIHSPRPMGLLASPHTYSFPSGHTTLAVAIYGFLAVLIARETTGRRHWFSYGIAITLATLVALSRLYLGAHWLTDVVGGFLLGMTCLLFVTASYRCRRTPHVAPETLSLVAGMGLLITLSLFTAVNFHKMEYGYTPIWPSLTLTNQAWWSHTGKAEAIPIYRPSRLGTPRQGFNLQWRGDLRAIERRLLKQGWSPYPTGLTLQGTAQRIISLQAPPQLPLLPQLYHNRPPVLLMSKGITNGKPTLMLRLWKSDITLSNNHMPLWLGVVNYHGPTHKLLALPRNHHKRFLGATGALAPFLKGLTWKEIVYPAAKLPPRLLELQWDGRVMLIGVLIGVKS